MKTVQCTHGTDSRGEFWLPVVDGEQIAEEVCRSREEALRRGRIVADADDPREAMQDDYVARTYDADMRTEEAARREEYRRGGW